MKRKKYWEMTTQELATATQEFDKPFVEENSRPLTPTERAQWEKLKRGRGQPRNHQGRQRISVSLERGLLARVTAWAKRRHISRSQLLAQVIEAALVKERAETKP